jgi:hypothetical protein
MLLIVDNNVVEVQPVSQTKYCLREITRDGNCSTNDGRNDCYGEFMYGIGSWTMTQDCECQELPENKHSCACCVNCDFEANLLIIIVLLDLKN